MKCSTWNWIRQLSWYWGIVTHMENMEIFSGVLVLFRFLIPFWGRFILCNNYLRGSSRMYRGTFGEGRIGTGDWKTPLVFHKVYVIYCKNLNKYSTVISYLLSMIWLNFFDRSHFFLFQMARWCCDLFEIDKCIHL